MTDIQELLENVDLRAMAEEAGASFNGGNSSPCPLHGGDNPTAFHLYERDGKWRWHCFTNCPDGENGGDAIDFYMHWRGVDRSTAIHELAERAGLRLVEAPTRQPKPPPQPQKPPGERWQERARNFIKYAAECLWSEDGQNALTYLHEERGYTDETIRAWRLGYNPRDVWDDPEKWGVNTNRKAWCPKGIVFPNLLGDEIRSVTVRRPLPGDALARRVGAVDRFTEEKFISLRGGRRGLFGVNYLRGLPLMVMAEGEPDCILAWQEVGDMADVATPGGARHRLDDSDKVYLLRALAIVSVYDGDEAGVEGSRYLQSISPRVVTVRPPAHDLTDCWKQGGDLRVWLAGALFDVVSDAVSREDDNGNTLLADKWMEACWQILKAMEN